MSISDIALDSLSSIRGVSKTDANRLLKKYGVIKLRFIYHFNNSRSATLY